jgi:putative redox protein
MNIEIGLEDNKKVSAKFENIIIMTDQSVEEGGEGKAGSPFELFLASIGTCIGYYIKAFCDRRNISAEGIKISEQTEYDSEAHLVTNIKISVTLPDDFPDKYREAVIAAAGRCKVKRHLEHPPKIQLAFSK